MALIETKKNKKKFSTLHNSFSSFSLFFPRHNTKKSEFAKKLLKTSKHLEGIKIHEIFAHTKRALIHRLMKRKHIFSPPQSENISEKFNIFYEENVNEETRRAFKAWMNYSNAGKQGERDRETRRHEDVNLCKFNEIQEQNNFAFSLQLCELNNFITRAPYQSHHRPPLY